MRKLVLFCCCCCTYALESETLHQTDSSPATSGHEISSFETEIRTELSDSKEHSFSNDKAWTKTEIWGYATLANTFLG